MLYVVEPGGKFAFLLAEVGGVGLRRCLWKLRGKLVYLGLKCYPRRKVFALYYRVGADSGVRCYGRFVLLFLCGVLGGFVGVCFFKVGGIFLQLGYLGVLCCNKAV